MSGNRGPHRKGHYFKHRNDKARVAVGDKGREVLEQIDDNNEVIKMFREYAAEIDAKHDRHERIVKLSRDITIESKRIIFLLHSAATDLDHKREQIFKEVDLRLNQLIEKNFKSIALELEGQDPYLYLRAYTAGLQEFVEALLYYQYLRFGTIEPYQGLNEKFQYKVEDSGNANSDEEAVASREIVMAAPMPEFFFGMGDFTGELMRRCINNLASGNIDDCFRICNYVKDIYTGFLSINSAGYKELGRKIYVLKQSLMKMEYVCYTIQVRGSEIPRHMLATVINNTTNPEVSNEDDEGFY